MPAFTRSQHRRCKAMAQRQTRRSAKQAQITSAQFLGDGELLSVVKSTDSFDLSSLRSAFQDTTTTPGKKKNKATSKRKKTSDDDRTADSGVPLLDRLSLKSPSKNKTPSFFQLPLQDSTAIINNTMAGSTEEGALKSDEPPSKKKRTADRQITKDDDNEGDNGADENKDGSFVKADEEVMKKRRIVRARRPVPAAKADNKKTGKVETSTGSSNPFANTLLTSNNNNKTDDQPKVFGSGSGYSGFGAAVSATTSSSGFGTATSAGSGGFGSGTAYNFGFPLAATDGTTGTGASSSSGMTTTNLFDVSKGTVPTFFFGSSSNAAATTTEKTDNKTDASSAPSSSPTKAVVNLPDEVNLTTGEENEKTLVAIRVKSFKLVESTEDEAKEAPGTQEANAATPSVPPSSSSFAAKPKGSETDVAAGSAASAEKKDTTDSSKATDGQPDAEKLEKKWQEIGVGPIRLLEGGPHKYRLLQRYQGKNLGDTPTKVLINLPFWKESSVMKTDNKYLQLDLLVPTEAKTLEKQTYSLKFKAEEEVDELLSILSKAKEEAKSCLAPLDDESKTEETKAAST